MRRFMGFLLILRALSPFLFLAVLGIAGLIILEDLRAELEPPIQTIQDELDTLNNIVAQTQEDFEDVQREVTDLVSALEAFNPANLIPDISGVISIPSLTIPDVTIPIPDVPNGVSISFSSINIAGVNISYPSGISIGTRNFTLAIPDISAFNITIPGLDLLGDAIAAVLAPITEIFEVFTPAFESINDLNETLQEVPKSFETITAEGEALVRDVGDVVARWSRTLAIVFVVLALLTVIYFGVPFLDAFHRGLQMIRGLPVS